MLLRFYDPQPLALSCAKIITARHAASQLLWPAVLTKTKIKHVVIDDDKMTLKYNQSDATQRPRLNSSNNNNQLSTTRQPPNNMNRA